MKVKQRRVVRRKAAATRLQTTIIKIKIRMGMTMKIRNACLIDHASNTIREGQSEALQAQPVKATRSRRTRSGQGRYFLRFFVG